MTEHTATELAYKNGYEAGKRDGVVRCEDCRMGSYSCSNLWCDIFDKIMPENGYCCFGERKIE